MISPTSPVYPRKRKALARYRRMCRYAECSFGNMAASRRTDRIISMHNAIVLVSVHSRHMIAYFYSSSLAIAASMT
jgi:hypothetical protein